MIDWDELRKEYNDLTQELSKSDLDQNRREEVQKKVSHYANLIDFYDQVKELSRKIEECEKLCESEEGELQELFQEEYNELLRKRKKLEQDLEDIIYPSDPHDRRSVFLEIRSGAGGQEAALFVIDLFRMYHNYALSRHWEVSLISQSMTDIGGCRELIAHIKGKHVYKRLKFESGVHRVQRIPQTETQGRVHTSTVTVAVMPEAEDVEVVINPQEIRIDVFRASGAGGQHVNTTDSAVRITHIPTGIVVSCQDERSQIKNKAKGLKVLQARILEAEKERAAAERSATRKQQVGTGQRAEKIRTYNFPQNRVSDHRINLTLKKLDSVMQGHLDEILEPLLMWDRQKKKEAQAV